MRTNVAIEQFIQKLYTNYGLKSVSYGFNPVSETFIVRVDDESLMHDETFLMKIFEFTHERAQEGEWVIFVSPSDIINFDDYQPVARDFASSSESFDAENWTSASSDTNYGWSDVVFDIPSSEISSGSGMGEKTYYALAA